MSDKKYFSILNHFSGRRSGKNMLQAEQAMIEYVGDHLGKPIKIIMCDHDEIKKLQARLKEAEKIIDGLYDMCGSPPPYLYEDMKEYQQKYKVGEDERCNGK